MTVEKPWEDPKVGDVLRQTRSQPTRELIEVDWSNVRYLFVDRNGVHRRVRCLRSTWREWCSAEVAKGGSYVRGETP